MQEGLTPAAYPYNRLSSVDRLQRGHDVADRSMDSIAANPGSHIPSVCRQELDPIISNGNAPVDRLVFPSRPEALGRDAPPRRLPRRRAATACRLCRARKTKCDNGRPTCGYCVFQGARCVYADNRRSGASPSSPLAPSGSLAPQQQRQEDVTNAVLLKRINHLTSIVEDLRGQSATGSSPLQTPYPSIVDSGGGPDQSSASMNNTGKDAAQGSAFTHDGFGRLDVSMLAARTSACESILQWPALQDLYRDEKITSFPLQSVIDCEASNETSSTGASSGRALMQEDDIWPLCRRFLALIHIKNPILDVPQFKRYAREAAECGPGWDGRGCLVLLACALASLASPYRPAEHHHHVGLGAGDSPLVTTPTPAADDSSACEVYFSAAMRRLGLLPNSLMSIQCHYFAGLYEKFSIRPLSAWTLLQQACIRFQAYLYAKALSSPGNSDTARGARHIEQRLYWSCVKAECELRTELQLPTSGLLQFKYPDLFPSLSFPLPSETSLDSADGFAGSAGQSPAFQAGSTSSLEGYSLAPEEERSWLYYLAEISLRKIMNRILDDLYSKGEQYWVANISRVISQQAAYSEELALWRAHLPHQIQFSDISMPPNELSFFLKTRYLSCLEWISRPFLFYSTTAPIFQPEPVATDPSSPAMRQQVTTLLSQQCVDVCGPLIAVIARHHRHGGIWALLRRSFGAALLLLVSVMASSATVVQRRRDEEDLGRPVTTASPQLPDDWRESVGLAIATIRKWETGVADLCWMRRTLEKLLEATLASV